MRAMVDASYGDLMGLIEGPAITGDAIARFTAVIRQRIAPVNIARLLDPALKNMYRHTAVSL
jgi:tetracycline 7-halogenase / FADH2 O2-dependent halogenase